MSRKLTYGPRYARPQYTVQVRGESGCMMTSDPRMVVVQVDCYLSTRPSGIVDVAYSEQCAHCNGSGRRAGKRRLSWRPCRACGGQPELFSCQLTSHAGPKGVIQCSI